MNKGLILILLVFFLGVILIMEFFPYSNLHRFCDGKYYIRVTRIISGNEIWVWNNNSYRFVETGFTDHTCYSYEYYVKNPILEQKYFTFNFGSYENKMMMITAIQMDINRKEVFG